MKADRERGGEGGRPATRNEVGGGKDNEMKAECDGGRERRIVRK